MKKIFSRNLFFRTIYLLLEDINPIFVLEGDAPELKRDVMAARNAIQFKGAAPKSDKACGRKPDVGRKRFKGVLKEVSKSYLHVYLTNFVIISCSFIIIN